MKFFTITDAVRATGLSRGRLQDFADGANGIPTDIIDQIVKERKRYISFRDFAAVPRGDRYDGSTVSKNKLLEQLELNNFYGIKQFAQMTC